MKEKVLKFLTVIALIITLTSINVLFIGYSVVTAVSNELEAQGNNTNIKEVKFDAYYKVGNSTTHHRQANISDEEVYLYLNINVLEKGSVENGKIRINDANFNIKDSNNSSSYVKSINTETNEIELNSIIYNNSVEIEIPIQFNKVDNINTDYFSKENNITLEGTYREEEDEESLEGNITTKIDWTDDADVNMSQSIDKCVDLGDSGVLVQQKILTTVENGNLPRESEQFTISAPVIGDVLPNSVSVLANGVKLSESSVQYDETTGQVNVNKEFVVNSDGTVSWDNDENEYKVIYIYDQSVKENLIGITLDTQMNSKLYTKEVSTKEDTQDVELQFSGNAVSVQKSVTEEVYKGYLYANSANETRYRENNVIEISNAESTEKILVATNNSYFVDGNENQYSASNISIYKATLINKNRFLQLFGDNGYIYIKDASGNVIDTVNSSSETDESGNIQIKYSQTLAGIVFETSKPVQEGQFTIHNIKYIQGNTGYSKEQLKGFTRLYTNEVVVTNLGTDTVESAINLLDTTTEATLEVNNTNLSTLQMNENVQLTITLKTSSPKYDLFKNPMVELVLPAGISNIYVNSVSKVYADTFNVEFARIVDGENGQKVIQIGLSGEQQDYSTVVNELAIVINANVEFSVLTPSQKSSLIMRYTNDNGNEPVYQNVVDVNIQSKPGIMMYNSISGFNSTGESIYTIDDSIPVGVLEVEAGAITARANTAVINNYDIEVKNAVIVGRIPRKAVYGGTVDTTLVNGIRTNLTDVEILYSAEKNATPDDGTWTTDYTNAASYMIKLDSISAGQSVAIQYEFVIPENVGYGKSIYVQTDATYAYLGNENTQTSRIGARSENAITNNLETLGSAIQTQQGGLGIATSAVTGGTELEDGVAVYEGQVITYLTQITNNTGSDLHNISAVATQTNGNIYGLLEEEAYDPNEDELTVLNYHRYEELNTNIHNFETIETLANGESAILEYSVVAVETEDSSAQTYGNIVITADGLSDTTINTITNPIQQAELKAFMKSAFYEEEKLYLGQNVHMNLEISNISGQALKTVKGTIQLPEGTYLESAEDLIWGNTTIGGEEIIYSGEKIINTSYDQQSNVITFEINGMDIGEYTVLELYFQIAEYDEIEKDFPFYYQLEAGNVYTSNIAHLRSLNTKRNVFAEQTANIEDGTQLRNGDNIEITTRVENNSEQELHFIFSDVLPDGFTGLGGRIISANGEIDIPVVEETPEENQPVICENFFSGEVDIPAGESIEVILSIRMDTEFITEEIVTNTMKIAYGELNQDQNSVYQLEWEDGIDCSKEYNIMLLRDEENYEWLRVEQIGNPENNAKILDGQEIKYTFSIRNMQNFDINVALYDSIPTGMIVTSIVLDGNVLDGENVAVEEYTIGAGQTSILEISGYAYLGRLSERELSNYLIVETSRKDYESNDIVYTLLKEIIEETVTEEPGEEDTEGVDPVTEEPGITDQGTNDPGTEDPGTEDPGTEEPGTEDPGTEEPGTEDPGTEDPGTEEPGTEDPGTEDPGTEEPGTEEPGTDTPVEVGKYTISGIAWVDSNRDGRRDSSESVLSGINVRLIDTNTGSYVSNVSATTGSNGYYELSVEQGSYIVIFEYDTNRYTLTEYRKAGVDETQNSDAISRNLTVDGANITVGATDVINIDSTNIENIDIGLAEAQIFDLELDKYVSEIVLQTSKSTTQYGYNDQSLVKVEIPSREINNATVIIKYTIKVRNTGELAGYVQNITDYMPSDLNFSSELNSDWYLANSKLQNNSLSNKAIQPGETQTVDLVLVKSVNGDNTGTIINIAEIAQASNNLEISDTDSTPGNNNASEDDYGRAEVIISVGTGRLIIFISIIFAILALSGVSVYVINKKVLNKDEFNF